MHNELTAIDIKKMKDEIAYRQEFVTPKCKEEVQRTRALGDLSETMNTAARSVSSTAITAESAISKR